MLVAQLVTQWVPGIHNFPGTFWLVREEDRYKALSFARSFAHGVVNETKTLNAKVLTVQKRCLSHSLRGETIPAPDTPCRSLLDGYFSYSHKFTARLQVCNLKSQTAQSSNVAFSTYGSDLLGMHASLASGSY